ncbi:hypothetical protein SAMN02799630_00407 [Paenibacillus sp. UNCCL117]|uniref:hypothetical protein n=1 Tax=unclassified Paenibacillus TaxID=185978 RepID=UPI0008872E9B|nr:MULTISPECIES: hypothetical protein [unclassified Paenibacillus]SDC41163.1 hypothetical protein SAMN04488602_102125 [Paenibacillus sp. cl123]SFW13602.1 hypothetical protein SAMN02799630_00407 [Paenibacillus sp. UNCCL117]
MNLADMLSYADIHDLGRIAGTYECECNGHSKHELIQSILSRVGRRDVLDRFVEELSMEDIRFLNSLLFDQRGSFSLEELLARVRQSRFDQDQGEGPAEWNPRDMIARFKHRGWLFNGYSQQTRYLFEVPADLRRRFVAALGKRFEQTLVRTDEPIAYRDEQKLLAGDILGFLRILQGQDMMLTGESVMYKRNLQQILDSLAVREEPVGKTAWRFGYGRMFRDYPNRFSFIYDYCYFNDLITEHHQVLALTEKGREAVREERREDTVQLFRFWLRLYKGPVPGLQSIVHWLQKLASSWVTLSSVRSTLGPLIRPFYYDTPDSILEQRILQMMMHLGLIRIGEDEREGRVLQVTRLGAGIIEGTYVADNEQIVLPIDNK